MVADRRGLAVTVAFALSAMGWLLGFTLMNPDEQIPFGALAVGYLAVGSLVLGLRHTRLVLTLVQLWVVCVALIAVAVSGGESVAFLVGLMLGITYGTAAFAGWTTIALVGLTLARRNFWHESY